MQKKKIEECSPIHVQEKLRKTTKPYIAVADIVDINKIEHLIIDIYRSQIKKFDEPKLRIAINKKDFGTYDFEKKTWTRAKIKNLCLRDYEFTVSERNIATDNMEITVDMFGVRNREKYFTWGDWFSRVNKLQDDITFKEIQKKEKRKREELDERIESIGDYPNGFIEWIENELFKGTNYLFYKRKGRYAMVTCSACNEKYRGKIKTGEGYEELFEKQIMLPPKHGMFGRCERCGKLGKYIAAGRQSRVNDSEKCFVVQKQSDEMVVVRWVHVDKSSSANCKAELEIIEQVRAFIRFGDKKIQKDYHLWDPYRGCNIWSDRNLAGFGSISIKDAKVFPGSIMELKDTEFRYSAIEDYMKDYDLFNPIDYLGAYARYQTLEMMVKLGLKRIANMIMEKYSYMKDIKEINSNGKNAADVLKVNKQRINYLRSWNGNLRILKYLQAEKSDGVKMTEEDMDRLEEAKATIKDIKLVNPYMTINQFLNRVQRYANCNYGTAKEVNTEKLKTTKIMYIDYIRMRIEEGYDMSNSIIAYPRNLVEEHNKLVLIKEKKNLDKRITEVLQKYKNIEKRYRGLIKRYKYDDGEYVIRPAKHAGEIVLEGRLLHHCVGGDGYLEKHNNGESTILFLRLKNNKDTPYITIEIKENRIIQWYGAYDKKPDEENIKSILDSFINMLKFNNKEKIAV